MASRAALETVGLVKSFHGRRVVNQVSLTVERGEIVGLLGPNGAGKTTTFYLVVGLMKPDEGQILCEGRDITRLPMYERARQGISYLPQEASVFRRLTVEENILAILEALNVTKEGRRGRAAELMQELDISKISHLRGYALSGGERRRVEIARALATSPLYLLLDEPFSGIDPIVVADIQEIVFQLKRKGIGVVITDHNVRETLEITDRGYIISEGKILESGVPEQIAASERARKIYLGEKFSLSRG